MRLLFIFTLLSCIQQGNAQNFKYDNISYKTVFPEDLCKTLKENSDFTLIDVRTNGEFYDSSTSTSLNIGRLKNSIHIPVTELVSRWKELNYLKDKPLFIYCSHSQRSRRASKLLSDSGFTKVHNINGGLTRLLFERQNMPKCFENMYTNQLNYFILSPSEVMKKAKKINPFFIIDLRPDSVFRGISNFEKRNAMGYLKGAHNILSIDLEKKVSIISHDKPILVVDESGTESPQAAILLKKLGFNNVSILFNGMDGWTDQEVEEGNISSLKRINNNAYHLISGEQFNKLANNTKVNIIDIRTREQFENKSKNYWENIGSIKGAINIPFADMKKTNLLLENKSTPIVLYSFTNQSDLFESAKMLVNMGYKNVNILRGGIWNLRWESYNLKNKANLKDWLINMPEENQ